MGDLIEKDLKDAKPGKGKRKLVDGNGLELWIMPSGAKYWRFRFSYGGKRPELQLGSYPKKSLKQARIDADKARALVSSGVNPVEQRRQERDALKATMANTFGAASEEWFAFRSRSWKEKTSSQVRDYLNKDLLPALRNRPLDSITTRELSTLTTKIEERGAPDVAKKVRQWLAHIYSYARANGWTKSDPVRDLASLHLPQHGGENYPHLPIAELPTLLRELHSFQASPFVKGAAMLALWTANRPGVTRTLRWSEIDLDAALWTITKGRKGMKLGYAHLTPLPAQAIAMLRELNDLSGSFEYVFIGRNDPTKPISDGAVNALLKRLGYRGRQTAHGFRHLISTALNERGHERDWVERQLAHGDPNKVRGTYNKAMYLDQRRQMMQEWADILDKMREEQSP